MMESGLDLSEALSILLGVNKKQQKRGKVENIDSALS